MSFIRRSAAFCRGVHSFAQSDFFHKFSDIKNTSFFKTVLLL